MHTRARSRTAFAAIGLAALAACRRPVPAPAAATVDAGQLAMFAPLPAEISSPANPVTDAKVRLGRMLFYETRLSRARDQSCNSCHELDRYGADGEPTSRGFEGRRGTRNAPSVYNAAGQIAQFWDGRAATVEEQAKGPILNPAEMAMPAADDVLARLRAIPAYRRAFAAAFPGEREPITYDNVGRAIGAFERRLVTPSRWDAYLRGDSTALTPVELAGFREFVDAGCAGCHHGAYVGGGSYQKAGLALAWPDLGPDSGRAAVTHLSADRMVFKVPSLRNVAETGPYFHTGSVASLDEAVRLMARHQTGHELSPSQVASITAWLRTLTGAPPRDLVGPPAERERAGR